MLIIQLAKVSFPFLCAPTHAHAYAQIYIFMRGRAAEAGAVVGVACPFVASLIAYLLARRVQLENLWLQEYASHPQTVRYVCVCVCVLMCASDELIILGNKAPSKLDHVPNAQIAGICPIASGAAWRPRGGVRRTFHHDALTSRT